MFAQGFAARAQEPFVKRFTAKRLTIATLGSFLRKSMLNYLAVTGLLLEKKMVESKIPANEAHSVHRAARETTGEERTWAALAHLSSLATLLVAVSTAGIGALLLVFVPFMIYLAYKDKSDYVAYHALQAVALQLLGSIGLLAAVIAVVLVLVVFWLVTGLLSLILVGLILVPVGILLTVVLVLALILLPFALGTFSVIAGVQTANGADYGYPYISQWVSRWLAHTAPEGVPTG
jgi:hypothetical protein